MNSSKRKKKSNWTPEEGDLVCLPYSIKPQRIFMVVGESMNSTGKSFILLSDEGNLLRLSEDVTMFMLNLTDEK